MARWYRLSMMALILLMVWGCVRSSSLEGLQSRFTKAQNGVITDSTTGLDWYVGPNQDTNWKQAKAWTENLTVAGGGWRMPDVTELKALYQKGAAPNNMDPIFQTTGIWVWSGQLRDALSGWIFNFSHGQQLWDGTDFGVNGRAFAVRSRR